MVNPSKNSSSDAKTSQAPGEEALIVVRELDQRIQSQEARMVSMEGSITNLQQTISALVQQLSGFGIGNHQPRDQEVNFNTKPVTENVEELVIQPSSSRTNQASQTQFLLRNSNRRTPPFRGFVQETPHQHYQLHDEDSDGSDEERMTLQDWNIQPRIQPNFQNQPIQANFQNSVFKIKIDLPTFDGRSEMEEVLDWIKRVDNYFEYAQTP